MNFLKESSGYGINPLKWSECFRTPFSLNSPLTLDIDLVKFACLGLF